MGFLTTVFKISLSLFWRIIFKFVRMFSDLAYVEWTCGCVIKNDVDVISKRKWSLFNYRKHARFTIDVIIHRSTCPTGIGTETKNIRVEGTSCIVREKKSPQYPMVWQLVVLICFPVLQKILLWYTRIFIGTRKALVRWKIKSYKLMILKNIAKSILMTGKCYAVKDT